MVKYILDSAKCSLTVSSIIAAFLVPSKQHVNQAALFKDMSDTPQSRSDGMLRQKKPKKSRKDGTSTQLPIHETLGQSLSASLLMNITSQQLDVSTAVRKLGRPDTKSSLLNCDEHDAKETLSDGSSSTVSQADSKHDKYRRPGSRGCIYTLGDFTAMERLESLMLQYGTAGHMGVRDPSYSFYLNEARDGALYYKVLDKIAVIVGDPLCHSDHYIPLLREFRDFARAHHWGVAITAASDDLAVLAREQNWITMCFGVEKILNPITNPLVTGTGGKRTVTQCKHLLKSGMSVDLYSPSYVHDAEIEAAIVEIYATWRKERNNARAAHQAFMTVFDILSLPRLVTFIYTRDTNGIINGFAALRKLAVGFHIDPFIASPDAPKGTSDLLIYSAMSFCNNIGVTKLSLGFEPLPELREVTGMNHVMAQVTRKAHRHIFGRLSLSGKKAFHDRFHPDQEQDAGLHLIFLQRPGPRHMLAMIHFANISLRATMGRSTIRTRGTVATANRLGDPSTSDSSEL